MGTSIFGIGISGMNAAQAGLVTTGHNISNASTPGFTRQEVVQVSNIPQFTGIGFLGQGVAVSTVKRIYSDALANQLTLAQTQGSQLDAYYAQIKQLDTLLGDPSAGLAPALQEFFSGVAAVAAHPESVPSRQALLSSANALSARFRDLDQQLSEMRAGIDTQVASSIASINGYAQQIAGLNHGILTVESATALQPANDLRDQRDALVAAMNQEVRASVVKASNGSYDVFVGNGQPVVVGNASFALAAARSLEDPQRVEVGYQNGASAALIAPASLRGGRLGGLLGFRSETLDAVQNGLGRVAMGVAQTFNDQHLLGQDLRGALGQAFFTVAGPAVLPSSSNAGTGGVTATLQNVNALTTSDYRLQYNGASGGNENFTLTRISDGVPTAVTFPAAGGYPYNLNVEGITLTISAGAALNDSWLIEPTRLGAGSIGVLATDPAAIAAAAPIRSAAALGNSGSATISAGSVSSVAALPLPATVTLTFNAATGQFSVGGAVPAAGPFAYTSGSNISFNGISFSISGTVANGDMFTLQRNVNGIADNRNALALGALQVANTLGRDSLVAGSQPTTSFQGAYGQLVSQVGNTSRQMEVTAKAQANVIAQTKQAQQSVSGVNLDEEAANLLRYQQAYQASGKMMQIASTLFQTVLDLGR
ncbi:MAG: flagellar hook-associated protein FlgK [Betaproteobacteria bacterium]|nr:flagellar hook-associated protein FlgK [Betaproteobacteria bacterium]